jgi:hypothetical protein
MEPAFESGACVFKMEVMWGTNYNAIQIPEGEKFPVVLSTERNGESLLKAAQLFFPYSADGGDLYFRETLQHGYVICYTPPSCTDYANLYLSHCKISSILADPITICPEMICLSDHQTNVSWGKAK